LSLSQCAHSQALRPSPTRRSSDLGRGEECGGLEPAGTGAAVLFGGGQSGEAEARELVPQHGVGSPVRIAGVVAGGGVRRQHLVQDRKSTRLNSSHVSISYAVFCLK